jgi:hypothetical protein
VLCHPTLCDAGGRVAMPQLSAAFQPAWLFPTSGPPAPSRTAPHISDVEQEALAVPQLQQVGGGVLGAHDARHAGAKRGQPHAACGAWREARRGAARRSVVRAVSPAAAAGTRHGLLGVQGRVRAAPIARARRCRAHCRGRARPPPPGAPGPGGGSGAGAGRGGAPPAAAAPAPSVSASSARSTSKTMWRHDRGRACLKWTALIHERGVCHPPGLVIVIDGDAPRSPLHAIL